MKYDIIFTVSDFITFILVWTLIYLNYFGLVLYFDGFTAYS